MKIIVSHDIDHLHWKEHLFRDSFIPRLAARTARQVIKRQVSIAQASARMNFWSDKRINRLKELTTFLGQNKIPATFFLAMNQGLSLSYKEHEISPFIPWLLNQGFDVGLHGIAYNQRSMMLMEQERLMKHLAKSGCKATPGIRMHYLRHDETTPNLLADLGYPFDSTEYGIKNPYLHAGKTWMFPISIMETYAFQQGTFTLDQAKQYSIECFQEAKHSKLTYFTINFHDPYFDSAYADIQSWFLWIIDYIQKQGWSFVNFRQAVEELSTKKSDKNH